MIIAMKYIYALYSAFELPLLIMAFIKSIFYYYVADTPITSQMQEKASILAQ